MNFGWPGKVSKGKLDKLEGFVKRLVVPAQKVCLITKPDASVYIGADQGVVGVGGAWALDGCG